MAHSYEGKFFEADVELYYFNARWYDCTTGRFISEDPIRDGMNWYGYVGNNPVRFVDPTGLLTNAGTNGGSLEMSLMQQQNVLLGTTEYTGLTIANDAAFFKFNLDIGSDRAQSSSVQFLFGGNWGLNFHNQVNITTAIHNPDPKDKTSSPSPLLSTGLYDNTLPGPWYAPTGLSWNGLFNLDTYEGDSDVNADSQFLDLNVGATLGANSPTIAYNTQDQLVHEYVFGIPGYDWSDKPEQFMGGINASLIFGASNSVDYGLSQANLATSVGVGASLGYNYSNSLSLGGMVSGNIETGFFKLNLNGFANIEAGLLPGYNKNFGAGNAEWGARGRAGASVGAGYNWGSGSFGFNYALITDQSMENTGTWRDENFSNVQWNIGFTMLWRLEN